MERGGVIFEQRMARTAGAVYLIVVITGLFALACVPAQINVPGDIEATLQQIVTQESLFRLGIAAFLVKQVAFLLLPLALFRLFKAVDPIASVLMVALAAVSVPLALASLGQRVQALALLTDPGLAPLFDSAQRQVAAAAALEAYGGGMLVTKLFWGLWLLPFGYLVLKSRFLARILGVLLLLGGAGYLIEVFGAVLVRDYYYWSLPMTQYVLISAALGEIGTCLWLLLAGGRFNLPLPPAE